jgi:hypothetical protein
MLAAASSPSPHIENDNATKKSASMSVSSSSRCGLVEGAVAEHGEQDIDSAAG